MHSFQSVCSGYVFLTFEHSSSSLNNAQFSHFILVIWSPEQDTALSVVKSCSLGVADKQLWVCKWKHLFWHVAVVDATWTFLSFFSVMISSGEEVKGLNLSACIPSNSLGIFIWNVNKPMKADWKMYSEKCFEGSLSHPIWTSGKKLTHRSSRRVFSVWWLSFLVKMIPLTS